MTQQTDNAAALVPDNHEAWADHGQLLVRTGRYDEAFAAFETARRLAPDDNNAAFQLANLYDDLERYEEACALYQQIFTATHDPAVANNLANTLSKLDRNNEAFKLLGGVLATVPDFAVGWNSYGGLLLSAGRFGEATEAFGKALALEPDYFGAMIGQARTLKAAGDLIAARGAYERTISFHADQAFVWSEAGVVQFELNDHAAAEDSFCKALALDDSRATDWNNYGSLLLSVERFGEAADAFGMALALNPEYFRAMIGKARALKAAGQLITARAAYEHAISLNSEDAFAWSETGVVQFELNDRAAAEGSFRKALALDDSRAPDWNNLANIMREAKRPLEALAMAETAMRLDPSLTSAQVIAATASHDLKDLERAAELIEGAIQQAIETNNISTLIVIASIFEDGSEFSRALTVHQKILDIDPHNKTARSRLFDISLSLCAWDNYDGLCTERMSELERSLSSDSTELTIDVFNLQALPVSYETIGTAARVAARQISRDARRGVPVAPFVHAPRQRQRIRIGYLLAYTWLHSLPLVLKELVARHDRTAFEIYGYSINACPGTDFSKAYRAAFDHFRDLPSNAPATAAKCIHDDGIDILIDVTGLTATNCMPISSFRPAPVQIHAYGYSITTGADYVDYLITDRTYIPPEWEALGTEKLIYLPDTFMPTKRPQVSQTYQPTRNECGLPDNAIVFCNFNHPCKFEPTAFAAWMDIMRQVPGSVLWLGKWSPDTERSLLAQVEKHGVSADRLVFAPVLEHDQHLSRLQHADLALDCLHHGGGITTVDALWVGVPVLTVLGNTPASRLGATLVGAAGVPELVQPDLANYVKTAVELSNDRNQLRSLNKKLLDQREHSPLFDNVTYAKAVDAAFNAAWENHCAGNPPRRIEITRDHQAKYG